MNHKTTTALLLAGLIALVPAGASLFATETDPVAPSASTQAGATSTPWLVAAVAAAQDLDAAGLARAITAAQAEQLGVTLVERPGAVPALADSLTTLMALHGVAPSVESVAALATLETAPQPLRGALAQLLADFVWYSEATFDAVSGVDVATLDLRAPAEDVVFPLGAILSAQNALLADAASLDSVLSGSPERLAAPVSIAGVLRLELTGACNDDLYTEDVPLLVDECGDDVYRNNAGGGHAVVCPSSIIGTNIMPAAALFDHAGDDSYESGRNCGINGGGALGAGLLFDGAGNDAYISGNPPGRFSDFGNDGVNGGAVIGSGVLVDASGSDVYEAGGWGTNGGGYPLSRALLVDDGAGDDTYTASFDAVNGGGAGGLGTLCDMGGHDWYEEMDEPFTGFDITAVPKTLVGAQLDWA